MGNPLYHIPIPILVLIPSQTIENTPAEADALSSLSYISLVYHDIKLVLDLYS
jgi:hypothetical protein